jgi:trans-aconitate methyltransferase
MSDSLSQYLDTLAPWDGALYAANTGHHRRYDDEFLATLPLRPTDRVLDIGCGSGDFTATVAALVPYGEVVGLEPQPSLVAEAEARAHTNQSFVTAPAQQLRALFAPATFDVAYSRSVIHWIPAADHGAVFAGAAAALRPGGALRVECGGGDNVREVVAFLDDVAAPFGAAGNPWTFRGAGDVLDQVLGLGLRVDGGWVRTVAQRRSFDRDSLLGWLRSQAVQAYEQRLASAERRAELRAEVERRVDELRRADGTYDLTFVRLDLLVFAPA